MSGTWHEAYLHTRRSLPRRRRRIRLFGLEKAARILELGCGDGLNLKVFRELDYRYLLGVDVSFFLLKRVREGLVVQADASHLPFRAHSYDVVYVDSVLHHLEDLPQALKELRRVLTPQGLLCFIEPRTSLGRTLLDILTESPLASLVPLLRHRRASLREEAKLYHAWLKVEPSLPRLLAEHGFRPLLVHRDLLSVYGKYQKVDNGGRAGYNSR